MPWVHLYVDTFGKAKACCVSSITYGNVRKNSIEAIWEGESIEHFRKKQLAGEWDKRCAVCYNREKAGKSSIRTETLEKFGHLIPAVMKGEKLKPVYFDIRFSNVCNFKCVTCWHGASSSWFEEAKKQKNNVGKSAIIKATKDNFLLVENILKFSPSVEEIYFAGGEPLLMEEHYYFLKRLIDKKLTDVLLRYNTNFSTLSLKGYRVIDYWKHFERVTLSLSIDGVGKKGEKIRRGLSWDKFIENIKTVRKSCAHIKVEIAPTVSNLNVCELGEIHRFFYEEGLIDGIDAIYLNVLERPFEFNISRMDDANKRKAIDELLLHIEWLKKNEASNYTVGEFEAVLSLLDRAKIFDN